MTRRIVLWVDVKGATPRLGGMHIFAANCDDQFNPRLAVIVCTQPGTAADPLALLAMLEAMRSELQGTRSLVERCRDVWARLRRSHSRGAP